MKYFTIYGLVNPITGELFYIGCTKYNLYARLAIHITAAKKNDERPVYDEVRQIIKHRKNPIIITIEEVENEVEKEGLKTALSLEAQYIISLCELGTLKNICWNKYYSSTLNIFWPPKNKIELWRTFEEKDSEAFPPPPYLSSEERITWHNLRRYRGLTKFCYDAPPTIVVQNKKENKEYNPYNNPFWMKKMGITV